jgi:hypothetical protein
MRLEHASRLSLTVQAKQLVEAWQGKKRKRGVRRRIGLDGEPLGCRCSPRPRPGGHGASRIVTRCEIAIYDTGV